MNNHLLAELTRQALLYLQDRFDPTLKIPTVAVFKQQKAAPPPQKKEEICLLPPSPKTEKATPTLLEPTKQEELPQKSEALREQIKRLLPHICLLETPFEESPVALICFEEEELSFYQSLAAAIHKHLSPVKLFSGKHLPVLTPYRLVIAPEKASLKCTQPMITTLSANHYLQKPGAKKELWNLLCQKLKK